MLNVFERILKGEDLEIFQGCFDTFASWMFEEGAYEILNVLSFFQSMKPNEEAF